MEKRATQKLLEQLVANGQLELEGDDDALTALAEHATQWLVENVRHAARGARFASFLERHPSVAETFATDELLEEKLAAWDLAVRRFAPVAAHRNPELERQIYEDLDDDALRLVYGDWLQQQGDPLGELIVRQAQGDARSAKRLLSQHATFFWGPLEEYLRLFKLEYHLGVIQAVTLTRARAVEIEWPVVAGWLFERPLARFVRSVQIGPLASTYDAEVGVWNALLRDPRHALRSLGVACTRPRPLEPLDLGLVPAGAPRLEELRIHAGRVDATRPLEHATLRRLALRTESVSGELGEMLGAAVLPALEALAIHTLPRGPVARLLPRHAPSLRTLRVRVLGAGAVIDALLAGPLLPQLVELEVAGVDDVDAKTILADRDRFGHLKKLALPSHALGAATLRELRRVLPVSPTAGER